MKDKIVNVVIPIYKDYLNPNEIKSFDQCLSILGKYPITIFTFNELIIPKNISEKKNINIIYFDKTYFQDINSYNKLLMSKKFYKKFIDYKFILIYQLDAWVFSDNLIYWCNKSYDYIGAPWIIKEDNKERLKVGNGGLSLRKVESHLKTLRKFKIMKSRKEIIKKFKNLWELLGYNNNSKYFTRTFKGNEDYFWSHFADQINTKFKVSTVEDAIKFSFSKV